MNILQKIWARHFFKAFAKSTLFIITALYFLSILLDLVAHISIISKVPPLVLLRYYLCLLSRRLEIFIPFSLLISTVRVLFALSSRNELVAMLVAGVSLKKLMQPFLICVVVSMGILYCNMQFFLPKAAPEMSFIQETFFGKKKKQSKITTDDEISHVVLKDGTQIVFQLYRPREMKLYNLFLIRSLNEIYYMRSFVLKQPLTGFYVEKIIRNPQGELVREESYDQYVFNDIEIDIDEVSYQLLPPKQQSISSLIRQALFYQLPFGDYRTQVFAQILWKLIFPFICLLAFIGPAPYCLSFQRIQYPLIVYLGSIALFFCFFFVAQAFYYLSIRTVPVFFVWLPWLIVLGICSKRYQKL